MRLMYIHHSYIIRNLSLATRLKCNVSLPCAAKTPEGWSNEVPTMRSARHKLLWTNCGEPEGLHRMLSSMLALEKIDFEFLLTTASIRAALLLSEQFC